MKGFTLPKMNSLTGMPKIAVLLAAFCKDNPQRIVARSDLSRGIQQNNAQSTPSPWKGQWGGMFPNSLWQQGTIWFCNQWHSYGQSHVSWEMGLGGGRGSSIAKELHKRQTPVERSL